MVQEIRKQVCLAEIVAVSAYVRFHPQDSRLPSSIAVLPTFDRGVCIGGPHLAGYRTHTGHLPELVRET